jgi:hypothetical protein
MAKLTRHPAGDPGDGGSDADRDRAVEALVMTGLDRYFAGDFERAIHAWTRVLFLDRTHARARAYIERARLVLSERQRETDELLHRGLSALDAGDADRARALLTSAVERGGAVEEAEMALERLVRLDVAGGPQRADLATESAGGPAPGSEGGRRRLLVPWILAVLTVPLLVVAAALALRWSPLEPLATDPLVDAPQSSSLAGNEPVPEVAGADLAIRRARSLSVRGHLHEALAELERVRPTDPRRPEADRLQAEVQRTLLDAVVTSPPGPGAPPGAGRP